MITNGDGDREEPDELDDPELELDESRRVRVLQRKKTKNIKITAFYCLIKSWGIVTSANILSTSFIVIIVIRQTLNPFLTQNTPPTYYQIHFKMYNN